MQQTIWQFCEQDGFPKVEIDGDMLCSAEYADWLVGGQRVDAVTEHDGYLWLTFANGCTLPLTCPCCGGRLHLMTLTRDQLGRLIQGRALEGFRHGEWVGRGEHADRHPIFALQFAGEEDTDARTIRVNLDSVRQIRRP